MNTRRSRRVLATVAMMIIACIVVSVQSQDSGEWISFPNTTVGQTQTVPFTYTLLESSATPALVTVSSPTPPFGVSGPLSFTLSPGESRTLSVTFSPTEAGSYEGSFSVSAVGGIPPQVKTTYVTLTGTGVSGSTPVGIWNPFTQVEPITDSTEVGLLEVKLDEAEVALADLRQRLDSLGWWLGRLTNGAPLRLGPQDTNPMPETSTWAQLQMLEAKIDLLLSQPTEITMVQVYDVIVQINILMVEVNQWVINLGGNVAGLEAKLDYYLEQPGDITIVEVYDIIVQINVLIVQINQWVINIGSNVDGLEAKLDQLQFDIDDIYEGIFGVPGGLLDLLWEANGNAIAAIAQGRAANEAIADLNDRLNDAHADVRANATAIARLEVKADAGEDAIAALEVKADANAAAIAVNNGLIGANGVAIAANAGAIAANGAAIAVNNGLIGANGVAIAANAGAIAANGAAIGANAGAIAANGAAIGVNAGAIAANGRAIQVLRDSNNRLEDKLNQLLRAAGLPAPPSAADAAKITLTMGGGPLPSTPFEATVEGSLGAVQPNAVVTIYWPLALPPSTVTADGAGAFTLTVPTGSISYFSVEVTQTVGGYESAPVRIPAS